MTRDLKMALSASQLSAPQKVVMTQQCSCLAGPEATTEMAATTLLLMWSAISLPPAPTKPQQCIKHSMFGGSGSTDSTWQATAQVPGPWWLGRPPGLARRKSTQRRTPPCHTHGHMTIPPQLLCMQPSSAGTDVQPLKLIKPTIQVKNLRMHWSTQRHRGMTEKFCKARAGK